MMGKVVQSFVVHVVADLSCFCTSLLMVVVLRFQSNRLQIRLSLSLTQTFGFDCSVVLS